MQGEAAPAALGRRQSAGQQAPAALRRRRPPTRGGRTCARGCPARRRRCRASCRLCPAPAAPPAEEPPPPRPDTAQHCGRLSDRTPRRQEPHCELCMMRIRTQFFIADSICATCVGDRHIHGNHGNRICVMVKIGPTLTSVQHQAAVRTAHRLELTTAAWGAWMAASCSDFEYREGAALRTPVRGQPSEGLSLTWHSSMLTCVANGEACELARSGVTVGAQGHQRRQQALPLEGGVESARVPGQVAHQIGRPRPHQRIWVPQKRRQLRRQGFQHCMHQTNTSARSQPLMGRTRSVGPVLQATTNASK